MTTNAKYILASLVGIGALIAPLFAFGQTVPNYSVTIANSTQISPGGQVQVVWNVPTSDSITKDWVAIFKTSDGNSAYKDWKYVTTHSGSLNLIAPTQKGTYEVRYLKNDGYTSYARSSTFTIGSTNPGSYTVSVSNSGSIEPGGQIQVNWNAPAHDNRNRDWVAVYSLNDNNQAYKDWKYVSQASGSVILTAPTQAGTYEIRYLKNDGFTDVAQSSQFVVQSSTSNSGDYSVQITNSNFGAGSTISITWNAPANANINLDWIGLYRTTGANTHYLAWKYVNKRSGSMTLTIPQNSLAGTYEVRYLKNDGYTDVARSNSFTIGSGNPNNPDLTIVSFGDSITAGVGTTLGNDFSSVLSRNTGVPIINEGNSGDTTGEALARLQSDVLNRNPDIVIVLLGGNDIIQQLPVSTLQTNLTTIVQRIQASGATAILVGLHGPIYSFNYEPAYQSVASATGALYVPNVLMGILGNPYYLSDLVHPNDRGHLVIASRILPTLQSAINARQ